MMGAAWFSQLQNRLPVALARAGQRVAAAARENALGSLADNIRVDAQEEAVSITATAPYAAVVELGSARRAARPFLRPALLDNKDMVFSELARTLRERSSDD
jgi:HK97 gp10 family phage protein